MGYQRTTAHTPDQLRFLVTGDAGTVELRVTPAWSALVVGEEAECQPAEEIVFRWHAMGQDDMVIWFALEDGYLNWTTHQDVSAVADDPRFSELREMAAWVNITEACGSAEDKLQAEEAHMAALRRLIRGNQRDT